MKLSGLDSLGLLQPVSRDEAEASKASGSQRCDFVVKMMVTMMMVMMVVMMMLMTRGVSPAH